MRPGPKKPGESAAEYNARVKAMEQKWMSGMGRPKGGSSSPVKTPVRGFSKDPGTGAPKPRVGGVVKGASKPIGQYGGGRGPTPIDYPKKGVKTPSIKVFGEDGKRIPDRKPVPFTGGGRGMKTGGMVKGKK